MNWQERIYESLIEAELIGVTRGPKRGQKSRTYRRGGEGSRKRTTVSVGPSGNLRRKSWEAGGGKTVYKSGPPMNVAQARRKRLGMGVNP